MIVERNDEIALLESLLDDVPTDGGRVILVRGEAGIGKTALVDAFIEGVRERAHVLLGACDDLLTPQPLGPIWDAAQEEGTLTPPLLRDDRRAVMATLRELLSRDLRPTVLVIEDTQWAGEATLDVIKFLGRRIARMNGLLILTYRDGEVDSEHPLRQVIGDLPPRNLVRIQLAPLSEDGVASMLNNSFDVHDVMTLTDGNPLFVTEVAEWGIDRVPTSIRESVLARAGTLSPESQELLDLLSIIPGAADEELVTSILDVTDVQLSECRRHGLLNASSTRISFAHELQRRAIESALPHTEKKRIAGVVLAKLPSDTDPAVKVHFATQAHDGAAMVEFAPQAARAAAAMESHREAAAHYRTLEPHLADIDLAERATILDEWARVEFYMANARSIDLASQAIGVRRSIGDDVALAQSLTLAALAARQFSGTSEAVRQAAEAVELLEPTGPSPQLAHSLSIYAFLRWLEDESDHQCLPLARRALSIAQETRDAKSTIDALHTIGQIEYSRGNLVGMNLVEESLTTAINGGFRFEEVRALSNIAGMAGDARDVRRAIDFSKRARDTAARYEIRNLEVNAISMFAEFLLWTGDWDEAENVAADALDSSADAETIAWRVLGTIQARRGRSEARPALDRMWQQADGFRLLTVVDPAATAIAEYIWLTGDSDPTWIERLKEILAEGVATGTPWPSGAFMFWMWKLDLLPTTPQGSADFYKWIVTGDYQKAVTFWENQGAPYEQGLALMHGDETEQIRALRIFEELGASATAEKLRRKLRAAGVNVPRGTSRSTRHHGAGLTARQSEVLNLVAEGLTNAEIADKLFVSHRTVENHVSAVLLKLDAPDRTGAVSIAHELGIVTA